MRILMVSNLYVPHVGGVARSVQQFTAKYRARGHDVLVVCPEFVDAPEQETDVVRVPAIQNFNGTDFSVTVPVPGYLSKRLEEFDPQIVHSHHPFLLGNTAARIATQRDVPLVYTFHTMYEHYAHYVPLEAPQMRRFARNLATGYAGLSDRVIAPSESVRDILRDRGVETPIEVIPTGVEIEKFREGEGARYRRAADIPEDAWLVGHLGRLAPEKNLGFLTEAVARFLERVPSARFLVVGAGPSRQQMIEEFERRGLKNRLHLGGTLEGQALADAYAAMDVFAFASKSETQGMVLVEAMAASTPVVALDAPGAREVVEDQGNGRLLEEENAEAFADALDWCRARSGDATEAMRDNAARTAEHFTMERCADRALALYEELLESRHEHDEETEAFWEKSLEHLRTEWNIWKNAAMSAADAFTEADGDTEDAHKA